jgi:DNA-directed RNA polymerase subunit RPC12/RpoP
MAKIKIICLRCGELLQCDESHRGRMVKCPHCKHSVPVLPVSPFRAAPVKRQGAKRKILVIARVLVLVAALAVVVGWFAMPVRVHWPDHRPIGVLFLASNFHSSATNPRGWFNDPGLDVTGPDGPQRFRKALLDYADRSIAILKRTGAQGAIVWDLEGEQFPHKISFIGDPRLLDRLAPEMVPVADEFFGRLRSAGLKVGLTIRPQQLVFDAGGLPRQTEVLNLKRSLLAKIDYARKRWGATLFYVDSNGGIRRPDEAWQFRRLVEQRPDILLIPEHHYLPYWSFSAPYSALRQGDPAVTANWARRLFPGSFQALDVDDVSDDWARIAVARSQGDILLFRAWFWSPECRLLEGFAHESK